jgi:putative ubiquitin-RnfH superfamily antitoxin RatB of RatAB toxin-antitoxin module
MMPVDRREGSILVQVAYVDGSGHLPRGVSVRFLELPAGATLSDALAHLDDPRLKSAIASGGLVPALYGERVRASYVLRDGDRLELLGPLIADPKQSRGRRAEVQRARSGDARWSRR